MEEIWKDIPWYDWKYQVSNLSRFKSIWRHVFTWKNKSQRVFRKGMILKTVVKKCWYSAISFKKDWIQRQYRVHRLIAEAFIPNPENKPQVNHINGIKTDNRVENLEWCTQNENMRHAYDTWLEIAKRGKDNIYSKVVLQYNKKWIFIKEWACTMDTQRKLWFYHTGISRCCNWKQKLSNGFIWKFKV